MLHQESSARRSAQLIGVALAAVVALAGCSAATPDDEGTGDGASSASAVVSPPAIDKEGILEVCVNLGTPPNEFADESGEPVGAEIDLARAVAGELGLKAEFVQLTFGGLIPALQAKQCDVIMTSLYIKPEREEVVDFVPYLESGSAVAVSKENPANITGYNDSLCGTKVLATVGATGADLVKEMSDKCVADGNPAIEISLSDANSAGLQQVIAGQVDAYIDTAELVGYYQKLSNGDFQLVGEPFGTIKIGAATNKGNDELHNALNTAFETVISSGEYDDILAEWGLEKQTIVGK